MPNKTEILVKPYLKNDLPDLRPGDTVRVRQKIKDIASPNKKEKAKEEKKRSKEKTQTFEGLIIARKHGKGINATITVRRVISGVGVERVFPIHSPMISKIEIVRRGKIRRAKLYYLRTAKGKKSKLKRQDFSQAIAEPAKETPSIPESAEPK
ncbi:MAG: 50S ribosomal protein L19 [Parcubacteria group bacterium GW2011_GWA2_38_27]|nr:MAG: 50S ribosomal protein L19 [Parcubacteria group bacterium GW2011_GWA2_38_27]